MDAPRSAHRMRACLPANLACLWYGDYLCKRAVVVSYFDLEQSSIPLPSKVTSKGIFYESIVSVLL